MSFNEMFRIYPNRNTELRVLAQTVCEFGRNIAKEPSAAHSNGMDEHALKRQRSYVEHALAMTNALQARPIPDKPITHDIEKPINLSDPYLTFVSGVGGELIPVNDATQLIAEKWMECAVELARSQSAALAGSLTKYDYDRMIINLQVIDKMLDEMEARPFLDLPETAVPGAELTTRSSTAIKSTR